MLFHISSAVIIVSLILVAGSSGFDPCLDPSPAVAPRNLYTHLFHRSGSGRLCHRFTPSQVSLRLGGFGATFLSLCATSSDSDNDNNMI